MFSSVSGMKLNIDKTEGILLGPLKDRYDKLHGVRMTYSAVKILGIYIGHDAVECNEKNWIQRIQKNGKTIRFLEKKIFNSFRESVYYKFASIV